MSTSGTGKLLIQSARIVDSNSPFNGEIKDVLVADGKIARIEKGIKDDSAKYVPADGLCISPGIFDMQVSGGEPGFEDKEDFASLNAAAMSGGVTEVLLMPSLNPVTDQRSQVEFLRKKSSSWPLKVHPVGAVTAGMKGALLAEMHDMALGGALAFCDDKNAFSNPVALHLAMQYNHVSGGLLMVHCEDQAMSLGGKVNEGLMSVRLGMKGAPDLSEELGVMRNLALAEYHNARIHFNGISSARALQRVREAKSRGIRVSCSVYAHHLYFDESSLADFDSTFKVWPPLRTAKDKEALLEGLRDGTIDVICSDHRPETIEHKQVEFDYAAFGTIGLETLFPASYKATEQIVELSRLINLLCHSPRQLLGIKPVSIQEETAADFFLYNPEEEFTFTREMIKGKSANSAFIGSTLKGRIYGTCTPMGWISAQ